MVKDFEPYDWPQLEYGNSHVDAIYIHEKNIDLVLDLVKAAINSQHDGVKQLYAKLTTILTQSLMLVLASLIAEYWLYLTQNVTWPCVAVGILILVWSIAAFFAAKGIRTRQVSALGIDPRDGLKQDLLQLNPREAKVWAIETIGNTYIYGKNNATMIGRELNRAINCVIAAPICSFVFSVAWNLYFHS